MKKSKKSFVWMDVSKWSIQDKSNLINVSLKDPEAVRNMLDEVILEELRAAMKKK